MERLVPTWALLNELPVRSGTRVAFSRVMRQRRAFVDVAAGALRHPALEELLDQSVARAADGVASGMAKIVALEPDGALRIIAGRNLHPGVAGNTRLPGDASNPAGQCVAERRIVNIPDLRLYPQYQLPPVYREHRVVSTANIPIMLDSGPFGLLEIDAVTPRSFDEVDLSFLVGIAGVIGEGVARVRREAVLNEELNAREILLREHHHRVRNQYQVLSSVLRTHARQAGTQDSRDRFLDVERRLFALASLYDHLLGADQGDSVELQHYMASLCSGMRDFYGLDERGISLVFRAGVSTALPIDTASMLGLIVNELVANSVEHAFGEAGGEISICVEAAPAGGTRLVISDNGRGYTPAQQDSTGMRTVHQLLDRLGATIEASGKGGAKWDIQVPADPT